MSHPSNGRLPLLLMAVAAITGLTILTAQAAPDLTDAEVAHVAVTANSIDVALARFAQSRIRNEGIRKFAATMIADHTAVNEQAAALAGKLGVTPKANAVSQSLLTGAAEARAAIEPLRGGAFDRAYIEREVAYHQAVLNAIDGVLVPATANAELKQLLVDVRPAIAAHLEHAKQLRNSLGSAK